MDFEGELVIKPQVYAFLALELFFWPQTFFIISCEVSGGSYELWKSACHSPFPSSLSSTSMQFKSLLL